jgi:pilus assembly protein Flp/PilA
MAVVALSARTLDFASRSCPRRLAEKGGETSLRNVFAIIATFVAGHRGERDEDGQTLVEYGLLLALIAIIVIVALLFLGPIVSQIFQNVGSNLSGS